MRLLAFAAAAAIALAFLPSADAVPDPLAAVCTGPNEAVLEDVSATLDDPTQPECGSLSDPCYRTQCGGCGPELIEWIVGPIYCF